MQKLNKNDVKICHCGFIIGILFIDTPNKNVFF